MERRKFLLAGPGDALLPGSPRMPCLSTKIQMPDIPNPKRKIGRLAFVIGSFLFALAALAAAVALAVFLIRLIFWF